MAEDNKSVQLGCGTLIAIAIIVMIFSGGRSDKETRKELRRLNEKIERLEKKIDALTAAQKGVQKGALLAAAAAPAAPAKVAE